MGAGNSVLVSMLTTALGSTPPRSAIPSASSSERPAETMRKLPISLTSTAVPASSPKSKIPLAPIASSTGRTRSFASCGPATGIHSCLAAAASGRPKTGAST
ncbi:hypothetical protein D3C75_1145430 [compost metagenome]